MQRPAQLIALSALVVLTSLPAQAQWSAGSLSPARTNVASATVGDLVLFAGGNELSTYYKDVDIYNAATDTWSPSSLSVGRTQVGATAVGTLVLFAGGYSAGGATDVVDVLDVATMTWSTATLSQPRVAVAATTVGSEAIFAGGSIPGGGGFQSTVDIYDATVGTPDNPAAWRTTALSVARSGATAASVGNLAIFAGGSGPQGVPYDDVDIYDSSTGVWSTANLSVARNMGANASAVVGTRAYFGGGHFSLLGGPDMSDVVDVYDAQTGTWSILNLSSERGYVGVTAVGNKVLFAGGAGTNFVFSDVVDIYNAGTQQWDPPSALSQARSHASAATVGSKALFAGGGTTGAVSAVVDIYETLNAVSYCFGDPGSGTPCPCANDNDGSVPGSGCANGAYLSGARLSGSGTACVSDDTLTLTTTGLDPNNTGLYFQANDAVNGGDGNLFGDGLRCAGGGLIRLQIRTSNGDGVSSTSIAIATKGGVAPGDVKRYQCWYRDTSGAQPCGPGTNDFNLSNGYEITWLP